MRRAALRTPVGWISVTEQNGAITHIDWTEADDGDPSALLTEAARQIGAYFSHDLKDFDLPLAPAGDAFQQSVNAEMQRIPWGETVTYGDIAKRLGSSGQPVGRACGGNTIPIVIPCHRVVGVAGLTGYSGKGGVETKVALLRHEGSYSLLL